MPTTTPTPLTVSSTAAVPAVGSVLRAGTASVAVAATATALIAAAGHAAGISLEVSGAPIPVSGFAVLTVIFSIVGVGIALALRRFAARPRTGWLLVAGVLTVLSLVPDALADATVSTKVLLMLTHVVAAAIVVPTVARRLT